MSLVRRLVTSLDESAAKERERKRIRVIKFIHIGSYIPPRDAYVRFIIIIKMIFARFYIWRECAYD